MVTAFWPETPLPGIGEDETGGDEPSAAAEEVGRLVEGDVLAVGLVVRGVEDSANVAVG